MSWNPLSPVRRRVLLLACGLASALSGLAVATAPTGEPSEAALSAEVVSVGVSLPESGAAQDVGSGVVLAAAVTTPEVVPAPAERGVTSAAATGRELLRPADADDAAVGELAVPRPAARPAYRIVWMEVTAYCACTHCCGPNAQGITASGRPVSYNRGRFVAADTRLLPFYTKLSIPGYHGGELVPVLDRGGAIKGNKLDVYFDSHETARQWGRRWLPVRVYE
ncbi:MAG: 3D domain-containing protein [Tepidisphaerales bacterium]